MLVKVSLYLSFELYYILDVYFPEGVLADVFPSFFVVFSPKTMACTHSGRGAVNILLNGGG